MGIIIKLLIGVIRSRILSTSPEPNQVRVTQYRIPNTFSLRKKFPRSANLT